MAPPAPSAGARLLLRRLLSTATEAAAEVPAPTAPAAAAAPSAAAAKPAKKDPRLLYRRLSALGIAGEGSVSRVLNKWVREGGAPRSEELVKHVKELRRYKRHAHALEVYAWLRLAYQPSAPIRFEFWLGLICGCTNRPVFAGYIGLGKLAVMHRIHTNRQHRKMVIDMSEQVVDGWLSTFLSSSK